MFVIPVIVFLLCLVVLMFVPISINVKLENGTLYIYLFKFKIAKQNIKVFVNKENIQKTKLISVVYLKLLTKVNYKGLHFFVEGINYDMSVHPAYYGALLSILSTVKGYLYSKGIEFDYEALYQGDAYVEFDGKIELHLGMFLVELFRLRRVIHERESN